MNLAQKEALVHIATVGVVVELVTRAGVYFTAHPGSGAEEVAEDALTTIVETACEMPKEAISRLLTALASLVVEYVTQEDVSGWAAAELEAVNADLEARSDR